MSEPVWDVTVVCESHRHARGKIATVAVYTRRFYEPGQPRWQRKHLNRSPARRTGRGLERRRRKRIADAVASGTTEALMYALATDQRQTHPRCSLCGAELLEPNHGLLERLANQGVSRISIRQLHTLRFRPKR
jgi:hypothetical protein